MRARIVLSFITATLGIATSGCGSTGDTAGDRSIVAAFYPLTFAAEQIVPDAGVSNLTPAGAEPHDLELSARDIERVRDADLVLYLGSGFMPALEDAVSGAANAADLLDGLQLLGGNYEHGHGDEDREEHAAEQTLDPHVWLDPMRYAAMAERIAEALGDPEAAADLVAELEELDAELRAGLESCERRTVVTSHAAFAYLADAYGLEQIALTGISPEAEPSAKAIEELVAEVDEEGATTVFFETLVSPRLAETVAREAGATTAVLNPLEGLTEDEVEAGADYFSVMRANLDALRTALGCT
ncbi:MAG TPA: metal ABC transporter substrate-binding protein [Gaiellaceae bacterium]|nr:metal ABC transporter substrate-binding protein [Gaiellaceae bacterium]